MLEIEALVELGHILDVVVVPEIVAGFPPNLAADDFGVSERCRCGGGNGGASGVGGAFVDLDDDLAAGGGAGGGGHGRITVAGGMKLLFGREILLEKNGKFFGAGVAASAGGNLSGMLVRTSI